MDAYRSHMRISLPPGELLRGKKHTYTAGHIICLSGRSVTVSAESGDGGRWRIKYYNGKSAVTIEMLERLMALQTAGVVPLADVGMHAGSVFFVSPSLAAESLDRLPLPLGLLAERIIPQLFDIVEYYHKNGILLRDICPEHLLYLPDGERLAYCGFGNAAQLTKGAERSKSPGYGQHFAYLAPEIERYGYSRASDYFSVGATILALVEGRDPAGAMSGEAYLAQIREGMAPGMDVGHLWKIPYELYSLEDKILYLALGLLNADPLKRWGGGEARCWCGGEEVPLVREGKKTDYRFSESFAVSGRKCWNERELAEAVAADTDSWNEETLRRFAGFSERQHLKCAEEISGYAADRSISPKGRIFRCIYTLHPALGGLWWDGKRYADMRALRDAAGTGGAGVAVLSQLLRDGCLSFLSRMREKAGASGRVLREEFERFEDWERAQPGKGLYRCMMRFAPDLQSRFFLAEGKRYHSVRQMLTDYREHGERLRACSGSILAEPSFQAWLWAGGMERAGERAAALSGGDSDKSFFLLLCLCESRAEDEETKKLSREMYLRFGEYAPIAWLAGHTGAYRVTSPIHRVLYDTFRQMELDAGVPLREIFRRAREAVTDYQMFVGRTFDSSPGDDREAAENRFGYVPLGEEYRFCCKWRDMLEVCPAFLESVEQIIQGGSLS